MILAVIACGGVVGAAAGLWSTLSHKPAWHGAESALTIIAWAMPGSVIAVVLAIRGPRLKPFSGVFERLFCLSWVTWVLIGPQPEPRQRLRDNYARKRRPRGTESEQRAACTATVHLNQDGNAITSTSMAPGHLAHVSEIGIAKKVPTAIEEAFAGRR